MVDLNTNLKPDCDGYCHCVLAVDCFSKWVKLIPLQDKLATTLAEWWYRELLFVQPRFKKPCWLKYASSHEFMGAFTMLCDDLETILNTQYLEQYSTLCPIVAQKRMDK